LSARVSPTDRVRGHIDELFGQDRPLPEILEEVARLGAQLLIQAALEAEVTEFLGRDRYQRAASAEDARPGSRNGYREVTVKTTAGPVTLSRPKLRGTTGAFASRLFGSHVTKTNALESLVIASFVRGLSVRDVEAALAEALGDQAAIADGRIDAFAAKYKGLYPSAVKCLLADREGLTAYLRFLAEHHKRIRQSNFIVIYWPLEGVCDVADDQLSAPHLPSGRGIYGPSWTGHPAAGAGSP